MTRTLDDGTLSNLFCIGRDIVPFVMKSQTDI